MKKLIIVLAIIVLITSLVYLVPRLVIIVDFIAKYGMNEDYQDLSYDHPYLGKYVGFEEAGLTVNLPVENDGSIRYIVEQEGALTVCDFDDYEVTIIELDDNINSADYDNALLASIDTINKFEIYYLGTNFDDMKIAQPIYKLELYREMYEVKYRLLEEWGPKYLRSSVTEGYELFTMFNDSQPEKSNYNVISIIIYDDEDVRNPVACKLVQIKRKNEIMFTDGQVISMTFSLEVLDDN